MRTRGVWCLGTVMVALLTGCKPSEEPSEPQPIIIVSKVPTFFQPWDRHKVFPDCEDTLKVPCVTFDDGKWRKVVSYKPYASSVIKKPIKVKNGYRLR